MYTYSRLNVLNGLIIFENKLIDSFFFFFLYQIDNDNVTIRTYIIHE